MGRPAPLPAASRDLLAAAARGLAEASVAVTPGERYAHAHLAALRAAAAVLAARARPASSRARIRSVWVLLPAVAPDLTEWAAFFAAGAGKRAAAEAGLAGAVTEREADDLVRDAETFLALVATALGLSHQLGLPSASRLRSAG
ncbi:MAG: SAV_6107 family HEPN domain-containing protein [Candidatus Nanopelagicales bacterium]